MIDKESISEQEQRSMDIITEKILRYKCKRDVYVCKIGELLRTAKARLGHGNFLKWLDSSVFISEDIAEKWMKIAGSATFSAALRNFGLTKTYALMTLSEGNCESFLNKLRPISRDVKPLPQMTTREFEAEVKQYKETLRLMKKNVESSAAGEDNTLSAKVLSSKVKQGKELKMPKTKSEFHTRVESMNSSVDSLLKFIENCKDDQETYDELSSALRHLCETTLQSLKSQ